MKNKITIRISDDLRDQLNEKAQLEGISTSELARTILDEFCNPLNDYDGEDIVEDNLQFNEVDENEIDKEEEYNSTKNELHELEDKFEILKIEYEGLEKICEELENPDIIYSIEFLQLVCWVYYQRSGSIIQLSREQCINLQETIINANSSEYISTDLKNELKKVLANLVNAQDNWLLRNSQLDFSKGIFPNFKYSLLNDFIFNKNCGTKTVNI